MAFLRGAKHNGSTACEMSESLFAGFSGTNNAVCMMQPSRIENVVSEFVKRLKSRAAEAIDTSCYTQLSLYVLSSEGNMVIHRYFNK